VVDACARTYAGFDRVRPNSITSVEFGGIRLSRRNLVEFNRVGGIWWNSMDCGGQSQTVADSYLSSVSPRHSYCNWGSPVTKCQDTKHGTFYPTTIKSLISSLQFRY